MTPGQTVIDIVYQPSIQVDPMSFPTLETARLILRPPEAADFEAWAEFSADAEATRFIGGPVPRAVAWRSMAATAGSWVLQGFGIFSVIDKSSRRWLGRVGPLRPEGWPGTEVGWALVRDAQGRGIAHEAAVASIDFAFDELGWTEVIHCIDDGNAASIALARRLGSVLLRRAVMPPPIEDKEVQVWGQSAESWRQRRRQQESGAGR